VHRPHFRASFIHSEARPRDSDKNSNRKTRPRVRVFLLGRKNRMSKIVYQLDLVIYWSECKRTNPSFYAISVTVQIREVCSLGRRYRKQGRRHLRRARTIGIEYADTLRASSKGRLAIGSNLWTHNYTLARHESGRKGRREGERWLEEMEHSFVHAQHFPTRRASRHEEFRSLIYSWPDPAVVHRGVRFDCASL